MLAYSAASADVRDTIVDGRVLMRDRTLLTLDETAALNALAALA
jgi:5-methylthioadenosine/S-adenosylhomocysteine deaminase